jgi:Tfp pilus assembly protein PilF
MKCRTLLAGGTALTVAACAAMTGRPGDLELEVGVRVYESGRFADAAQYLQRSLDFGLHKPDEVAAHKYLAFIHCAAGREPECRQEFRLALALDPAFDLKPAEAGHPTWGPVFRSLKNGRAAGSAAAP